jgi:N-acetylneuraminic acid mutarotase
MPERRLGGAAVALNEKLYLVGGVGGSAALLEYDPATDTWTTRASLAQPRDHVAAAALDGEIYALGGRWSGVGELASVEIYNPANDAWRPGPGMPRPHAGFSAAAVAGHILAAGGEIILTGNETLRAFEIFNAETGVWAGGPDLPYPIHGVAAAALDGRFYLLGGSARAGAIENPGYVMIYTP